MQRIAIVSALAAALALPAAADTAATQAFSDARLAAFGAGDIEALLAQYADDAVIVGPEGIFRTADERRVFIVAVIGAMGQPDLKFEMLKVVVDGDLLHYVWKAETGAIDFGTGVETYLVRDGKAVWQTEFNAATPK